MPPPYPTRDPSETHRTTAIIPRGSTRARPAAPKA